jgi:hypothetical protein
MIEIRLLDSGSESYHREARIQQGFGDVSSEATVGPGYKGDFSCRRDDFQGNSTKSFSRI